MALSAAGSTGGRVGVYGKAGLLVPMSLVYGNDGLMLSMLLEYGKALLLPAMLLVYGKARLPMPTLLEYDNGKASAGPLLLMYGEVGLPMPMLLEYDKALLLPTMSLVYGKGRVLLSDPGVRQQQAPAVHMLMS